MNKLKWILLLAFGWVGLQAQAQIKLPSAVSANAKNATATTLANMDKQLMSQFKLDGVKSEIVGNLLKLKVGDSDLSKMTPALRTQQGNQLMDAATKMLGNGSSNLKSFGISNMLVEMLSSLNAKEVLQSIQRKL